jgi:nicotinate-nucleotide adenylyltransferase
MMKKLEKGVAIFGGTFDPPHNGHISIAAQIADLPFIDKLLIVPTCATSYKEATKFEHRIIMCRNAFCGINKSRVYEADVQFTADLILKLRRTFKKAPLYLFVGSDWNILTFRHAKYIQEASKIFVIHRPNYTENSDIGPEYYKGNDGFYHLEPSIPMELSSSQLRSLMAFNRPVIGAVPDNIIQYAKEHKLYGKDRLSKTGIDSRFRSIRS